MVDRENTNNWKWFVQWLVKDLNLEGGQSLTIISDMQKVSQTLMKLILLIFIDLFMHLLFDYKLHLVMLVLVHL